MYIGKDTPIVATYDEDSLTITWKPNPTLGALWFGCALAFPLAGYLLTVADLGTTYGAMDQFANALAKLCYLISPILCYLGLALAVDRLTVRAENAGVLAKFGPLPLWKARFIAVDQIRAIRTFEQGTGLYDYGLGPKTVIVIDSLGRRKPLHNVLQGHLAATDIARELREFYGVPEDMEDAQL